MKIVQLNTQIPWRGGEQQVLYLSRFLQTQGHDNVIISQPHGMLYQRARDANVPAMALRMRHELDLLAAWRLGRYLRKHNVDILHMHTPHAHTIGLLACTLAPQVHKVVSRRIDFVPIRNLFSRWKYTLPNLHYLAVSDAVKDVLVASDIPASRVQTVYSGVDLRRFDDLPALSPLFPTGTRVIGTAGHLAGHKGHRYLLEAFQHLLQSEPNVGFVLIGDGALRTTLEAQAATLGIADRVCFTGFRHDVLTLMQEFEIFVFASTHEGMPNGVLEAMAMRKPVVATPAGGTAEAVQDGVTGLIVPHQDAAALARAMQYLLHHPEQGRVFGEEGRKRVEHYFTSERMAIKTLRIYQLLLDGTPIAHAV